MSSRQELSHLVIARAFRGAAVIGIIACGTVEEPRVVTVELSPQTITLTSLGDTIILQAIAKDAKGNPVPNVGFTWSSSKPEVATVSDGGRVIAVANGLTKVTATGDGVTGSASLTITQQAARITLSPDTARVRFGQALVLTPTVLDARGSLIADAALTWLSTDTSVVTIISPGRVKGVGLGTTSVLAQAGSATGSAVLAVDPIVIGSISTGGTYTCALMTDDVPYCWGNSVSIGDSSNVERIAPEPVAGGLAFHLVSASRGLGSVGGHSCGITPQGSAYCWGPNGQGQLGDGTMTDRFAPVAVAGGLSFVAVSAGGDHSCGLSGDSTAYCWGRNTYGQLGDGTEMSHLTPVAVSGGVKFSSLQAGGDHTCGLTADGVAYCWGDDSFGQLGDSSSGTFQTTPVAVSGGHVFLSLTVGNDATCGIESPGVAYCWGWNTSGELGDGTTTNRTVPTKVAGSVAFTTIDVGAGNGHTCGLAGTGVAYCWGNNYHGALGVDSLGMSTVPVAVSGGLSYRAIYVGGFSFTCGLSLGGEAYCWGDNSSGQLGNGNIVSTSTPTLIKGQQ